MQVLVQKILGHTVEKSQTNATNVTLLFAGRRFEDTLQKAQRRKVELILDFKTQWRKVKQMQPM